MISPHVRESKTVLDSRFQVLDSECFVSKTWILDSLSCILNYKAQDPGFHSKNLVDSRKKSKNFLHSGIRIPLHGATDWKRQLLEFRLVETHLSTQATQREKRMRG